MSDCCLPGTRWFKCNVKRFKLDAIFAGALGTAVHAQNYQAAGARQQNVAGAGFSLDLTDLENRIAKQQETVITGANGKKKWAIRAPILRWN